RALGGGPERTRIAPPWACGVTLTPAMQFNATALAQPMSRILAHLLRPIRKTTLSYALKPYFINGVRHEFALRPVFERWLYRPATGALLEAARWARRFQSGGLRVYLGYMLATLVAVLLLTR
ncbi:MAG: hydrogenase 4 subunit B, partial [Chloroflexi bacterium]|nr:hydrogenase 4 subunit B [Chloroflexota bacterium]